VVDVTKHFLWLSDRVAIHAIGVFPEQFEKHPDPLLYKYRVLHCVQLVEFIHNSQSVKLPEVNKHNLFVLS